MVLFKITTLKLLSQSTSHDKQWLVFTWQCRLRVESSSESGQDTSGFCNIYTSAINSHNFRKEILHNSFKGPFQDYQDSNASISVTTMAQLISFECIIGQCLVLLNKNSPGEKLDYYHKRNRWFLTSQESGHWFHHSCLPWEVVHKYLKYLQA